MKYFVLFIMSIFSFDLVAEEIVESTMDWQSGILSLSIRKIVDEEQCGHAESFYITEREIHTIAGRAMFDRILDLQITSGNTFGDLARENSSMLTIADTLSNTVSMTSPIPNVEENSIFSRFELALYPALTEALVRHTIPFPMEMVLEWQPGSEYTGLVIYARRELPVHGENFSAALEPAVFPVIYDENLRLIVDRNRMNPEYARTWGGAAYSQNFTENSERVGENPLRILAVGTFGITPADIIIPRADADVLLHYPSLRKILQEGRILIIID
ncbi:MAG: hypothetical protein ACR2PY_01750 [Salinispira sp.]